ncbi:MAG: hypothetical protein IPH03_04110 [Tetrasphaera sp.]|nr:hypothetical protein [Tetrasphaera sp.]
MPSAVAHTRVRLVALLLLLAVAAPAALAAARYPKYWAWIALEGTPMTWLQTVLLVLAAAAAAVIALIGRLRSWPRTARWPYAALSPAFVCVALDDRFGLHERLSERVLGPHGVRPPGLTFLAPGDIPLVLMAGAGLLVLPFILRALRTDRLALVLFALGALTAAVSVWMGSIDPSTVPIDVERFERTAEECLELLADCFVLAALGVRLLGLLGEAAWPEPRASATTSSVPGSEPIGVHATTH